MFKLRQYNAIFLYHRKDRCETLTRLIKTVLFNIVGFLLFSLLLNLNIQLLLHFEEMMKCAIMLLANQSVQSG